MMLDYSVAHIYEASESFVETLRLADPVHALAETIRYLSHLLAENHDLHNVLNQEMVHLQSSDQDLFLNLAFRRVTMFEKLLSDGVKAGVFQVSDVSHAAQVISYLVTMWVRRYLLLRGRYTLKQHADQLTLEILKMLGVPEEKVRVEGVAITLCD
jgi:hypothetical protein